MAATAISAGIGLPLAVDHWLEPNLAADLAHALAVALHLPASAVSVADARLHAPARFTIRGLRVGRSTVSEIELRADPWAALTAVWAGRRPSVTGATVAGVDVAGIGRAGAIELSRDTHHARVVVKKVDVQAIGRLPWAVSSDEAAVEFEDGHPARVAFTGAAVVGAKSRLDALSGSASRTHDIWHVRAARPDFSIGGTLGSNTTALDVRLEKMALGNLLALLGVPALSSPDGTVDGTVSIKRDDGELRAQATLDLTKVILEHRVVAQAAIPVAQIHLDADASLARGTVTVGRMVVDAGDLHLTMSGSGSAGGAVSADLALGKVGCGALLRSLPAAALPSLEGLSVDGDFAGRAWLRGDFAHLGDLGFDVDLDVGCRVVSDPPLAQVAALAALNGPVIGRAITSDGSARPLLLSPASPTYRSLDTIPDAVVRPFLAAEDVRFWTHHGFDVEMIRRALAIDLDEGRVDRGASTISQQLVKNLFLSQERTLCRKVEEAVLTWRLEQRVGKARILELYLNLVELGPGIYGLGEGAERYFGKEPEELTSDEAAQLAALLPAPKRGMDDAWRRRYQALRARIARTEHATPRAGRTVKRR